MRIIKTSLLILLITALLFLACAEIYSHRAIGNYYQSTDKANLYLQKMLLYGDVNHYMDPRNHKDLNSDNIRYHRESHDLNKDEINVIFLGDSFVYGFLLSHRAAMPYQFEQIAKQRLGTESINGINFGWVSASPYLELNLLKKLGSKYQPDVVILDLDLGDFHDDIRYQYIEQRKSIYKLASWFPFSTMLIELFANSLKDDTYEKLIGFPKNQLFVNDRPIEQSNKYLTHTETNLDAIYAYTEDTLNAKFIVFINPKTFHYNEKESPNNWLKDIVKLTPHSFEVFDYIEELQQRKPYPIISLLPAFQQTTVFPTAFDKDAHWNKAGYKIAATEMVDHCMRLGCFNDLTPSNSDVSRNPTNSPQATQAE